MKFFKCLYFWVEREGGGSISLAIVQMLSSSHWDLYYEYVICLKGVGDKHQHWQDHLDYLVGKAFQKVLK